MGTTTFPGGVDAHPDRNAIDARILAGETGATIAADYPDLARDQINERARNVRKRKGTESAEPTSPANDEPSVQASLNERGAGKVWFHNWDRIPSDDDMRLAHEHMGNDPDLFIWWVDKWLFNSAAWLRDRDVANDPDSIARKNSSAYTGEARSFSVSTRPKTEKELERDQAAADAPELLDVESLSRRLRRKLPRQVRAGDGRYLVVVLADWQVGKGEGGGTPAFVERMRSLCVALRERLRDARRCGRPYSGVVFLGLGDLVEQCSGHYAMQAFGVDLDRRSQINLAADTVVVLVDVVLDEGVEDILIAAVPGNHGENRNSSGKAFTTWSDNDDLLLFDGVQRAFELAAARYGRVRFAMPVEEDTPTDPADPLVLVVDVGGVPVGLTHGHAKKGSGHAAPKMEDWWRRQCMGNRPVARAQILFSGHLHHYICSEATGRTFFQSPALDGGSYWYTASSGASSHPGVLMVDVGTVCGPRGWAHPDVAPCLPLDV